MPITRIVPAIAVYLLTGCVTLSPNASSDKGPPALAQEEEKPVLVTNDCVTTKQSPVIRSQGRFIVARFLSECRDPEGRLGHTPDSNWVAMGFPCSGGGGRIDVTGYYFSPDLVVFNLPTPCRMNPPRAEDLVGIAKELGLTAKSKLLAYYPFSLQQWRLDEASDKGNGFRVELRSAAAKTTLWKKFVEGQPIAVTLIGRENSWTKSAPLFEVKAELQKTEQKAFSLKVLSASPVNKELVSVEPN